MLRDVNHLSELTHLIYGASLHPERWMEAISLVHESMAANKSILFTPFIAPHKGGLAFPVGFSQAELELWATKFADRDYWGKRMQQKGLFVSGAVCTIKDVFPTKKEKQGFWDSPIYREYSVPINIEHLCVGVVFEGEPDLPPVVYGAWRGREDADFNQKDKDWMRLLIAHMSRSLGIMMRLDAARLQKATLHATLDRMKFGVALLNDELQVIHLNRAAQVVLERGDGLSLDANRMLESRNADTHVKIFPSESGGKKRGAKTDEPAHTLSSWLAAYKNMPPTRQQHFLNGVTVLRKADKKKNGAAEEKRKQYALQCAPLPNEDLWYSNNDSARYAVFITDPQSVQMPDMDKLVDIYGLTEMEAKIALEFVNRGSYKDVAQRLTITENTVRWHIKNIYPKLGVYKLADMVRMVMALGESGI